MGFLGVEEDSEDLRASTSGASALLREEEGAGEAEEGDEKNEEDLHAAEMGLSCLTRRQALFISRLNLCPSRFRWGDKGCATGL
uniref:Uncharacterized protein n=1 Tax=Steinernema glaseri TaxID=37863 RepID=A0A1I8ASC7_9BILA